MCNITIKVPVPIKKMIEEHKKLLSQYCYQIFDETEEYAFEELYFGFLVGAVPARDESIGNVKTYTQNQIYKNLLGKLATAQIDRIESTYLHEACNCAINGLQLSAMTMLGCAAECLLLQLSQAYLAYLKNGNGSSTEIRNFERDVINAKKSHARLDAFQRTVQNKERLFESLGLENANLHFSFLNLLRQDRNDSGHPTGTVVSSEDLNSYFANYQFLIERVHPIITKLPIYITT